MAIRPHQTSSEEIAEQIAARTPASEPGHSFTTGKFDAAVEDANYFTSGVDDRNFGDDVAILAAPAIGIAAESLFAYLSFDPGYDKATKQLDAKFDAQTSNKKSIIEWGKINTALSVYGVQHQNHFRFDLLRGPTVNSVTAQKLGFNTREFQALENLSQILSKGIYCMNTSIPSVSIETEKFKHYSKTETRAKSRNFDQVSATFLDDANGTLRRYFFWWMHMIDQNALAPYRLYPSEYRGEIRIRTIDRSGDDSTIVTFKNIFPTSLGDLTLDNGSESTLANFTVGFDYDSYEYDHKDEPADLMLTWTNRDRK